MLFQTAFFLTMVFASAYCAPHGLQGVEETYHLAGQDRPAVLSCVLYGGASADTIQWLFKGEPIAVDNDKYRLAERARTRLEIHHISGEDEGLYGCSYIFGGDRMTFDLLCIFVLGAAEFASNQTTTINALRGEDVELDARVQYNGAGPLNNNQTITLLQLFKGNDGRDLVYFCSNEGSRKELACPSTTRVIAQEGSHKFDLTLLLKNLSIQDSDDYILRIEVQYPGVSSRSYLTKIFKISVHEIFDTFMVQQNNNSLECQLKVSNSEVSGISLEFVKPNGEGLTERDNVQLLHGVNDDQFSLTAEFNEISSDSEGEYSCVASISLQDDNVFVRTASTVLKGPSTESTHGNDLQISIGPVTNNECGIWFDMEKSQKMESAVRTGLAEILTTHCKDCSIDVSDFSAPGRLRCSGVNSEWLNYEATISNIDNKDNIFQALEILKSSSPRPSIKIGLFVLSVNPACSGELPLDQAC